MKSNNPTDYDSWSDAAKRGYCARLEEMPKDSNPFVSSPKDLTSWNVGWEKADEELK